MRASAQDGPAAACVSGNLQLLIVSPRCELSAGPEPVVLCFIREECNFICRTFEQLMHTRRMLKSHPRPAVIFMY